jgi:hypothetical protein
VGTTLAVERASLVRPPLLISSVVVNYFVDGFGVTGGLVVRNELEFGV